MLQSTQWTAEFLHDNYWRNNKQWDLLLSVDLRFNWKTCNGRPYGWMGISEGGWFKSKSIGLKQDIFSRLETIQSSTNLIDNNWDIWTEFGVQRSGSLLFTTHCTDRGMPWHEIALQCHWETDCANSERSVNRSMIHTYSEMRNINVAFSSILMDSWDWLWLVHQITNKNQVGLTWCV
jgi:hypothetical protein